MMSDMEGEEAQSIQPEEQSHDEKWYVPLTRVTPLAKYSAMVLFVVLPFVGFWLGVEYGRGNDNVLESIAAPRLVPTTDVGQGTSLNELADDMKLDSSDDWLVYSNQMHGFSFSYPSSWNIAEDLSDNYSDYVLVELRECTREKERLTSDSCSYFSVQAQLEKQHDTIDEWYDAYKKDEYTQMFLRCEERTEFAEVPAYECYATEGMQPGRLIHYKILHNKSNLTILIESQPNQVMQDIIQTIQFIEVKQGE
jgi:hypothetical protein